MKLDFPKRGNVIGIIVSAVLLGVTGAVFGQTGTLTVKVDQPGVKISPMLYGMMTEEINHCYDGGLYAELVQNRVFKDDAKNPAHWMLIKSHGAEGDIALDSANPVNPAALPISLRMTIATVGDGQRVGVANDGYWGIPVRPRTEYRASFYARASADFGGAITVGIESADGASSFASANSEKITGQWKKYTVLLETGDVQASVKNRFVISAGKTGTVWLSQVSLFPPTYNNRPNGNRVDLMEKMAAMHPAFLRLPGGNYLEGNSIKDHYAWKNTLGDISTRPGHPCCWGYPSTDGMGLLEYLEWCEDLHMEPLLGVFAGYALNGEHVAAGPDLQPFVQEALDEIEYVTGDSNTTWGARRSADGHPEPFKLTYVEISNEDGRFDYDGRFAQFHDAIKAKYPSLQLIATSPVHIRAADLLDDHYYRSPAEMARDSTHYDKYDRSGIKIFVGEWASMEGSPTPTLRAALGDAAWLTGLERNSDIVKIAAYAPLLVNVNPGASQWPTNLIGYDALSSFGSPSYYAQVMFGKNRGDTVLPVDVEVDESSIAKPPLSHGSIGVGTWATSAEYKDLKVTHGDTVLYQSDFSKDTGGWTPHAGQWAAADGMLRQSSDKSDCRISAGDAAWTDYTYTLRARKISGDEGFLVLFHALDENNFLWWNIGGWGNSKTALERESSGSKGAFGPDSAVTVETGRWYDIRIEVQGTEINCYLDNKLITTASDAPQPLLPIYSTASRVSSTGEVIVKVVNFSGTAQKMLVNLQGVKQVEKTATAEVLSGQPDDTNSIAEPEKVVPLHTTVNNVAPQFDHEFPAYSVSVLRFGVNEQYRRAVTGSVYFDHIGFVVR